MLKVGRWALIAAAMYGTSASAQTADELIAKHVEALGGANPLAAIKSLQFEGQLRFPGDFELGYKETRARQANGTATRVDATLQGLTIVQAYDGTSGWRINPLQGRKDAETHRLSGRAPDNRLVHFDAPADAVRPGDVATVEVSYAAPHHLVAGEPSAVRRTRSGDAWESRTSEPVSVGVGLGMPTIGVPTPVESAPACG